MADWTELAEKAANGDAQAQGLLLEPWLAQLRAFIRVHAGPHIRARESVADLVQSVCREVLQDLVGVDIADERSFKRWLFVTAERKLADRARRYGAVKRGRGRPAVELESWREADAAALSIYANVSGPIDHAIAAETQARIERALQQLPEEDRRIVVLARIQNLSHAEIGQILGRSPSATRVLLFRALARLAKVLG